jgi:hypothetical protein
MKELRLFIYSCILKPFYESKNYFGKGVSNLLDMTLVNTE